MARAKRQAPTDRPGLTRPLLEFRALADFSFGQNNVAGEGRQAGIAGERYFTSLTPFANQAVLANPRQFKVVNTAARLPCLPRARWGDDAFRGKRVLFYLPTDALGENVAMLAFLHAFVAQRGAAAVGVFCAASSADIYRTSDLPEVYTLWIGRRDLKRWDTIVDLNQLEGRREIEFWPVDMEIGLLDAFGLAPSERYPSAARPIGKAKGALKIGVLPLATSPLRTLPPATIVALTQALGDFGEVHLCLNRLQHQGVLYASTVAGKLDAAVKVTPGFHSIAELLRAIDGFDYVVLADSGPAHMTKLFAVPGVAIYTSAPGGVLQGRFENLARWQVPFDGPHCRAPCGLAKVRQTADGRIGCMGSLGVPVEDLPSAGGGADPDAVARLMREPVPCVAEVAADPRPMVDFVIADLESRL
ncbi:MAG: glycosyltransferase family 9 protein [Alphaproteobacteria bacterium]